MQSISHPQPGWRRQDYDGRTGLMLATVQGHVELVQTLLEAGAQSNLRDNLGGSALMEACKHGHEHLVQVLRKAGATYVTAVMFISVYSYYDGHARSTLGCDTQDVIMSRGGQKLSCVLACVLP